MITPYSEALLSQSHKKVIQDKLAFNSTGIKNSCQSHLDQFLK